MPFTVRDLNKIEVKTQQIVCLSLPTLWGLRPTHIKPGAHVLNHYIILLSVTTTLEAKLIQQLAATREELLYMIFLDLHKAYDALDRDRCLEILEGYSVGTRALRILRMY